MTLGLLLVFLLSQDPLLDRLSSNQPEVREAAEAELLKQGEAARGLLEGGAKSSDSEVRSRCGRLLDVLERRRRAAVLAAELSPGLRRERPDLAHRLLQEDERAWISLLGQLSGFEASEDFLLEDRDWEDQRRTIASTTRSDVRAILEAYDRGPWRSVAVERLLYGIALACDVELPGPLELQRQEFTNAGHSVPRVMRSLSFGCGTRAYAFDHIKETDKEEYERKQTLGSDDPDIRREGLRWFLKHAKPELRAEAVHHLRIGRETGVEKDLLGALQDPDWTVVAAAVEATVELGLREAVDVLRRRAAEKDESVRDAVLEGLVRFRDVRSRPLFEAGLRDENDWNRMLAVRGLAVTADAESGKILLPVLKGSGVDVRRAAIDALVALKVPGAADAIRPLADQVRLRPRAVRALGRLRDEPSRALLRIRLDDLQDDVRREAALALAMLGETGGLGRVVEESAAILRARSSDSEPVAGEIMTPERFFVDLNRLAFPQAADRLFEARLRKDDYEGTWPELLSVWGKQSDWKISMAELPPTLEHFSLNMARARDVHLTDMLLTLWRDKATTLLIDGEKSVRIVTVEAAEAHWKAWKPGR